MENYAEVLVVVASIGCSVYGFRMLRRLGEQERHEDPQVAHFKALVPKIEKALDMWEDEDFSQHRIRLTGYLRHLGIPHPEGRSDKVWNYFLADLLPAAELGDLEGARRLHEQTHVRL